MAEPDRRHDDTFAPPGLPVEVQCLHCGGIYSSQLIRWIPDSSDELFGGHWSCANPECDGVGFGFDIRPTDPQWRDPQGRISVVHACDDFIEIAEPGGVNESLDPRTYRAVTDAFDSVVSQVDEQYRLDAEQIFGLGDAWSGPREAIDEPPLDIPF